MSGMKIIKPTVVTTAMLTSATVAEPDTDEVLWNAATAYTVGQQAIRTTTHMKYERKVAGTSATPPESDAVNWLAIGPTNRWAMFDRKVGTKTTAATSLSTVMSAGPVSGVAALELAGREAVVTMKNAPGGSVVYDRTVSLDGTIINSVYDWLFNDFEQLTDFVLTDLPRHYAGGELSVTINGTSGVACGVLQVGQVFEIGQTLSGATVGIIDYSRKVTDTYGNRDVLERGYSKRGNIQVLTDKSDFNKIYRLLASLRATPCVYIGADTVGYEPMINYGFYKDFSMVVQYAQHHLCNLEIEGL